MIHVGFATLPLYLRTRWAEASLAAGLGFAVLAAVVAPTTPALLFDGAEVRTNALFGLLIAAAMLPGLRVGLGEAESAAGLRRLRAAHVAMASGLTAACCLPFGVRAGGEAWVLAGTNALLFLGLMLCTAAVRSPVPDWTLPAVLAGVTYLFGTLGGEGPQWWAFLLENAGDSARLAITLTGWAAGAALFCLLRRPAAPAD